MKKWGKIIILAVIVIVIAVIIWLITGNNNNKISAPIIKEKESLATVSDVGYGWSVKDTAEEAAKQSIAMMKQKLGDKTPHYILLYYTIGYDPKTILKVIRDEFGFQTQIQGMSSLLGVMSKDGYHVGKVGSMAILGVASPKLKIGVAGVDLTKREPRAAGKKVVEDAIKNSGQEGMPKMVYVMNAPGVEEKVLPGMEEVLGTKVPIIGGSSGDNDLSGKWSQISGDEIFSNSVVAAVVYTDSKIGTSYEFGYLSTNHRGIATKVDGRILYEIDNRPAAEVYNEWTGGIFDKELKDGGVILKEATYHPIAKVLKSKETGESYLDVFHPGYINLPDKSITGFIDIAQNDEVVLLEGSWEWLVNRAQTTAHKAMTSENIAKGNSLFTFYTFCAGTLLAIPEVERYRIPLLLSEELGNVPFIGGFTLGEQVYMPGIGNRHANLVNSIAVISK